MASGSGDGEAAGGADRPGAILRCVIASDIAELCGALEAVDAFLDRHGVPVTAQLTVRLLAEEIVTNIIKYAHDDAGAREIVMEARLTPGSVLLRVTDDGKVFDPLAAPTPKRDLPFEEKREGGVGIQLLRSLAARLEYNRFGDKNVIEVTIQRDSKA